ncbi:hypothetical protein SteCoe_19017 [Stentor coeruleus]|uniref:Uncharacterized protein n=1 Tax=Stentor coeruleus TaxID=5963 RepID=A0A1R2BVG0_9CILI|nr:hypothetical protein SteCoe_19017 [Stentor coeruleus]
MLKSDTKPEQSSKNASLIHFGLPLLTHRHSESVQRERTIDLGVLQHLNETFSGTDCSSGGRFFRHNEVLKATRALSHSYKLPKPLTSRESYLAKYSDPHKSENTHIWEIIERIDTCKIRTSSTINSTETITQISTKINMWSKCTSEIITIIKSLNSELSTSLSISYTEIFSLFKEFSNFIKNSETKYQTTISDLNAQIKSLQKDLNSLQKQNKELVKTFKLEELKIKKEVEDMFPNHEEEIRKFKEESMMLRNKKYGKLPDALEKLYNDMNKEEPVPEMTDMDLAGIDADELIAGMMDKYKLIITATVKNVKKNIVKKSKSNNEEMQTEGHYIDPKIHDDLVRQLEKTNIAYQRVITQMENHKEDTSTKGKIIDRSEVEKRHYSSQNLQLKKELDISNKEIHILKQDLERKKHEIDILESKTNKKSDHIIELQNRIDIMNEKILDLSYELERAKLSRPTSGSHTKRLSLNVSFKEEEPKKNRLDEVTKSGFTVREELEKAYQNNLAEMRRKNQTVSVKKIDKDFERNVEENYEENYEKKNWGNDEKNIGKTDDKNYLKNVTENGKNCLEKHVEENRKEIRSKNVELNDYQDAEVLIVVNAPEDLDANKSIDEKNTDFNSGKNSKNNKKHGTKTSSQNKETDKKEKQKEPTKKKSKKTNSIHASVRLIENTEKPHDKNTKTPGKHIKPIEHTPKTIEKTAASLSKSPIKSSESPINSSSTIPENSYKNHKILPEENTKNPSKTSYNTQDTRENSYKDPSSEETSHIISLSKYYNQDEIVEQSLESLPSETYLPSASENNPSIKITVFPINSRNSPIKKFESMTNYEDNYGKSLTKQGMCDKICGLDFLSFVSVGIQVDTSKSFQETFFENSSTYFLPYNPNNVYGLRGDVFYQGSSFQPQARIPDMNTSAIFLPPFKLDNNRQI